MSLWGYWLRRGPPLYTVTFVNHGPAWTKEEAKRAWYSTWCGLRRGERVSDVCQITDPRPEWAK